MSIQFNDLTTCREEASAAKKNIAAHAMSRIGTTVTACPPEAKADPNEVHPMTRIDPKLLATAFVNAETATLDDVLRHVASSMALSATRRRDLASGLRRMAKAIGSPLSEAPADPAWLRPRVARIAPAAVGLTTKSWANAISDAKAALASYGIIEGKPSKPVLLSEGWNLLWRSVLASKDPSLAPGLGRFVRFLSRMGVAPGEVDDGHAAAYREALALNEIRRSPDDAHRAAVYSWNLAVKRLPDWPRQTLATPCRSKTYALPLDDFPATFAADLDRFLLGMTRPDPLDPQARTRPLRPATVQHRRAQILRAASALTLAGAAVEEVVDLGAIAAPANARRILGWMLDRNDGETSAGIAEMAITLTLIARRHLRAPEEHIAELARMEKRLAVDRAPGLTEKNRKRLRPLQDPATLRRLVNLPWALAAKADANKKPYAGALDMEMAVAIAILVTCPIRRKNLAEIDLERSLVRMRDGRAFLVFENAEIKNRRPIEFELPSGVIALIDRHLKAHRPKLVPAGSPYLFPRRDGRAPIEKSALSRRFSAAVRREVGLDVHPHLFRHLAAMIWLTANPGAYEAARRLLGHAELSTTLEAYVGFEAASAARLFAELVETVRGAGR